MKLQRIRYSFKSLKGQFMLFFFCGMVILLLVVSVCSYVAVSRTVSRIEERAIAAEYAQFKANLEDTLDSIKRQRDIYLQSDAVEALCLDNSIDQIDLIFHINEYAQITRNMIQYYPHICSVYLYLDSGEILCASENSVQRRNDSGDGYHQISQSFDRGRAVMGGIRQGDLPMRIYDEEQKDMYAVRVAQRIYNDFLVVIIEEPYFNEMYTKIFGTQSSTACVLDAEGIIISSPDQGKIGMSYTYMDMLALEQDSGTCSAQNGELQISWMKLEGNSMILVNERKAELLFRDILDVSQMIIVVFISGFSLLCLLFLWWMYRALAPLKRILANMEEVARTGKYQMVPVTEKVQTVSEMNSLTMHYNAMITSLDRFAREQDKAASELRKKELQVLRNQINPHFLFNTLNDIRWMSLASGMPHIADAIAALGGIVRPLFRSDAVTWSLQEEMEQLRLYMKIENIRFQGDICFREEIPPELGNIQILRFILQPLVENSISHGFTSMKRGGEITVSACSINGDLHIEVADNGKGMTQGELDRLNEKLNGGKENDRIGLLNTNRRLQLYYGTEYGVRIYHNGEDGMGLLGVITLPMNGARGMITK